MKVKRLMKWSRATLSSSEMSSKVEVVIGSPVHLEQSSSPVYITESKPGDPPGVRGFLKVNPAALGWLEILTGSVAFGLVFWNYQLERWFLLPASFVILTGVITATAACTRNSCLVVSSQVLNLINIFNSVAVLSVFFLLSFILFFVRAFLSHSLSWMDIAFVVCNILASIFSLIIFSTSCCWCKSRKRVMIIHMNTVSPAMMNDVVDHPVPVPPAYSPVPSSDPPAYESERHSSISGPSAPAWDVRRWKDELHRSRKPIQV